MRTASILIGSKTVCNKAALGAALVLCTALFASSALGQNWTPQSSGTSESFYGISFVDAKTGWAAGWDYQNIYHTSDGGQTWTTQTPSDLCMFYDIDFCDALNGAAVGSDGGILITTDGGLTWHSAMYGWWLTHRAVDVASPDLAVVVGSNSIMQPMVTWTTDGWQTYNQNIFYFDNGLSLHEGYLTDVAILSADHWIVSGFVFTGEGAICETTDGGATWSTIYWSTDYLNALSFPTAQTGYAVGYNGLMLKSTDGGATWTNLLSGLYNELHDVDFTSDTNGIAVGEDGVIVSTADGGATLDVDIGGVGSRLRSVDAVDLGTAYTAGDDGEILAMTGVPDVPVPTILANGSAGVVTINYGTSLIIELSVDPGTKLGVNADLWVVATSPYGLYSYNRVKNSYVPGLSPSYQGPLFEINNHWFHVGSNLPPGTYEFYVGVDMKKNGKLDLGATAHDVVTVIVK